MKKSEQKLIESRIQSAMDSFAQYDEQRMEQVKEKAFQEYQRRMASPSPATLKKSKIKNLCRGAMAACALALAFMVFSVVYSVLMPVTVGNANNFVYSAGIWINNTLHLGLEFEKPVPEEERFEALRNAQSVRFATPEEAAMMLEIPIYALDEEKTGCNLDEISIEFVTENVYRLSSAYTYGNTSISIIQKPLLDNSIAASLEATTTVTSPVGELYLWMSESGYRGLLLSDYWNITIKVDGLLPDPCAFFSMLHIIN